MQFLLVLLIITSFISLDAGTGCSKPITASLSSRSAQRLMVVPDARVIEAPVAESRGQVRKKPVVAPLTSQSDQRPKVVPEARVIEAPVPESRGQVQSKPAAMPTPTACRMRLSCYGVFIVGDFEYRVMVAGEEKIVSGRVKWCPVQDLVLFSGGRLRSLLRVKPFLNDKKEAAEYLYAEIQSHWMRVSEQDRETALRRISLLLDEAEGEIF